MERLTSYLFDRPVTDEPWFYGPVGDYPYDDPSIMLERVADMFDTPTLWHGQFSDAQLAHGFRFLIDPSNSSIMNGLTDESIALAVRQRLIESTVILFEQVMAGRCSAHPSCAPN